MSKRILILGLDSASLAWIEKWVNEGRLPNLGRLIARGATGILRSVNPPLSPAAWSSFATGMLPGKHGVFDHIYRRPGTYDIAPTNSRVQAGKTIWEIISQHGGSVGVVNVPETYPPIAVNGFMLSGMDTPSDEADFAYPAELKDELQRAIGGYKVFGLRSKEDLDRSIEGMHQTIPMRARAGRYLWETYQPDFMILVFMETDVIQHKCWKYMDPAHPEYDDPANMARRSTYSEVIPDIYTRIDTALGPWLDSLDEDATVIVISDHGAGPLYKFVYLNNWLVGEGYLHFKTSAISRIKQAAFQLGFTPTNMFSLATKLRLGIVDNVTNKIKREMTRKGQTTVFQRVFLSWSDIDWSRTKAYTLGGNTTGIYINLQGREPEGCVAPGLEYENSRAEIAARLKQLRDPDTGDRIVEQVFMREEIHFGPFVDRAPDVFFTTTAEAYVGFGGHEFAGKKIMDASPLFSGHHRLDGMITLVGRGIRPGRLEPHQIVDVSPTVLYLLGYPVPANLDGRVITQAFTPDFLTAFPIIQGEAVDVFHGAEDPYSQADEDEILSRLNDLGYL